MKRFVQWIVAVCYGCEQGITYKGRCSVCGAPLKDTGR